MKGLTNGTCCLHACHKFWKLSTSCSCRCGGSRRLRRLSVLPLVRAEIRQNARVWQRLALKKPLRIGLKIISRILPLLLPHFVRQLVGLSLGWSAAWWAPLPQPSKASRRKPLLELRSKSLVGYQARSDGAVARLRVIEAT